MLLRRGFWSKNLRRERDSAGLAAVAISMPSRGVRATMQQPNDLTVVRAVLVSVVHELARVRRIPKQPGACALGCCWLRRER